MTSLSLSDLAANDRGPSYAVDEVRLGWFMCPVTSARLLKDRQWATAAAFLPCPFNDDGPTERPRIPAVEIDGVIQDNTLDAFHRIARWPITREQWMKRRGIDA